MQLIAVWIGLPAPSAPGLLVAIAVAVVVVAAAVCRGEMLAADLPSRLKLNGRFSQDDDRYRRQQQDREVLATRPALLPGHISPVRRQFVTPNQRLSQASFASSTSRLFTNGLHSLLIITSIITISFIVLPAICSPATCYLLSAINRR